MKRVGGLIKNRRIELHMTQAKLAQLADVSTNTIQRAEYGLGPMLEINEYAVAKALGWPDDAFDRIRAGESPADFTLGSAVVQGDGGGDNKLDAILGVLERIDQSQEAMSANFIEIRGEVDQLTQMYGEVQLRLGKVERKVASLSR